MTTLLGFGERLPAASFPAGEVLLPEGARTGLVHRALELIRGDFREPTWQAFLRLTLGDQTAVEIAADLGLTPAAVRRAKYRVLCRLHDELARS